SLSLKRFGDWIAWWQAVVSACGGNRPVTPPPADWGRAGANTAGLADIKAEIRSGQEEPTLVLNLAEDRDLLNEFINESQEHLQNIEQGVLVLEDNPGDADTLNSIFRAFHTFKGGSGFLNLAAIQKLAHELESLLDLARQHKLELTPPVINIILEGG